MPALLISAGNTGSPLWDLFPDDADAWPTYMNLPNSPTEVPKGWENLAHENPARTKRSGC